MNPAVPDRPTLGALSRLVQPLTIALADLRLAWIDALLFDLAFRALALVSTGPIAAWLFAQLVRASGTEAIGNFDLLAYLSQPMVAVLVVLLVGANAGLAMLRIAGLQAILASVRTERGVDYREAMLLVLGRLQSVVVLAVIAVALGVLSMSPFAAMLFWIAGWLLDQHDINYYLEVQPPEWWLAAGLGVAVVAVAAAVLVRWFLPWLVAFSAVVLHGQRPLTAWWLARRLVVGQQIDAVLLILRWAGLWGLLSFLLSAALFGLGWLIVPTVEDHLDALIVALGGLTLLSAAASYVTLWVATCVGCSLCVRYYVDVTSSPHGEFPIVAPSLPPNRLARYRGWTIPVGIGVLAAISLSWIVATLEQTAIHDQVGVTAHRGASLVAPENTLPAIDEAIRAGATMVEVDVQRTSDGVLVVQHDVDLMRVAGADAVVSQSTLEHLRQWDVSRGLAGHVGTTIATLDEVIELTRGRIKLLLELKSYRDDSERLVEAVLETINRHHIADEVMVMSLEYDELLMIESRQPRIVTGFVASTSLGDLTRLNVDFLAVPRSRATAVLVATAHAQGKHVHVWTIDQPAEMHRMIDLGVDNIITNDPATLVELLRTREQLSTSERLLLRFRELYRWQ